MGLGEQFKDKADEVREKAEDAVDKLSDDDSADRGQADQAEDRGGPSAAAKNAKNDWDIAKKD